MGMFQRLSTRQQSPGLDLDNACAVVQGYANFLNVSPPLPGCVADSKQLPYDKELIKESIYICINATGDRELIAHLKNGYLMLCAWQDNVGDRPLGVDFTRLDLEADPLKTAAEIQQQSDDVAGWTPIVESEQKMLEADLMAFGV